MTYKEVKIWIRVLVLILAIPIFNSCKKPVEELVGNWVKLSDLDGVPRTGAVGFAIGSKGYLGTGYDGTNRLNDFWEYDVTRNTWTQKADFPGAPRIGATGFGTDTKGYIGTGFDGKIRYNDFYEFDPIANAWTKKADFAGSARYDAVAMAIGNKGYVGTGYDVNNLKDIWEFNPATDTWTQKTSIGGSKRRNATSFVIGAKGYVITGEDNNEYLSDLWEYDPGTDAWTKKRSIADVTTETFDDNYTTIVGVGKVGFTINGKGYLATGGKTTGTEVWEYTPSTDLWKEKTSFEGSTRQDGVGFAIANRGYVTTGKAVSNYFDDIWAFDPDAVLNKND